MSLQQVVYDEVIGNMVSRGSKKGKQEDGSLVLFPA